MAPVPESPVYCKNCGALLTGPYCSSCGQKDAEVARPVTTLVSDFLDGAFSLDSRVWRTIGRLLTAPGYLTRAYFDGRRAHYMPPLRLFLVSSLLFFATAGLSNRHILRITTVRNTRSVSAGEVTVDLSMDDSAVTRSVGGDFATTSTTGGKPGFQAVLAMFPRADDPVESVIEQEDLDAVLADPSIDPFSRDMVRGFQRSIIEPAAFNDVMNVWLPRMMFILVPMFALVLRLFYWRKTLFLAHHIFFALHFHSFVFVLLTLLIALVPLFGGEVGGSVFVLGAGGYLLKSMGIVYGQSRWLTVAKWLSVSALYFLVFGVTLAITILTAMRQL